MELKGAACVVTGAARGLGAALSRELAARGAQVMLSDIDSSDLANMGAELHMPTFHCNVTDREQVVALGRAAIDIWGKVDLWLNNAGVWMPYMPVENVDFNTAKLLMDVNYFGLAYGCVEAIKHMRERGSGVITNILSVRSLQGKALAASYSASKFAAEGFSQAIRDELKDSGISVVSVYPYRMKTTLFGEHRHEDYDQSMEPAEVAGVIVDELAKSEPSPHVEIMSLSDIRRF
jgi:NAD(P)-dependent dehydrogenase (short-subunit alcohol dehydrogenase family)